MESSKWMKKSTFFITIFILLIIFAISIISIIYYYENKNISANIPTEIQNEININNLGLTVNGDGA